MITYDRELNDHLTNVAKGLISVPDIHKTINPPTLWAYYSTLPKWCRYHPAVRHVLFAFEYNKPFMDFKQKEMAMNFMCSQITPIEGRLLEVITEVAQSNKIRLNTELAKQMMTELNFYELDIT